MTSNHQSWIVKFTALILIIITIFGSGISTILADTEAAPPTPAPVVSSSQPSIPPSAPDVANVTADAAPISPTTPTNPTDPAALASPTTAPESTKPAVATPAITVPTSDTLLSSPNSTLGKQQSPDVDKMTGALNQVYSLTVPPGRSGLTPQLALQYSSNALDNFSIVGYGWALSIPSIVRVNKTGVENLYATDYYSSSEIGELASSTGFINTPTDGTYIPKYSSGPRQKFVLLGNEWSVTDANGTTYLYGADDAARESDPQNPDHISKWNLSKVTDINGNSISYQYEKEGNKVYPKTISYSDLYSIEFAKEARADNLTSYASGFGISTNFRINTITIKTNGVARREYAIGYTTGVNAVRSLISQITETGIDANGLRTTLPPTGYSYENSPVTFAYDAKYAGLNTDTNPQMFIGDIDGNGLQDVITPVLSPINEYPNHCAPTTAKMNFSSGFVSSALNLDLFCFIGFYTYDPKYSYNPYPLFAYIRTAGERLVDINNDQKPDFVVGRDPSSYYNPGIDTTYPGTSANAFHNPNSIFGGDPAQSVVSTNASIGTTTSFVTSQVASSEMKVPAFEQQIGFLASSPSFNTYATTANLDGDPFPDATQFDGSFFKGKSGGWSTQTGYFSKAPSALSVGSPLLNPDLNGDGLDDWVGNGVGNVFLNTGKISSTTSTTWIPSSTAWNTSAASIQFADLNGDGLPDSETGNVNYNTGKDFSVTKSINGCSGVPGACAGTFYDVNGDGMPDNPPYINQAKKPDMLTKITYPAGGTASIEYQPTPQQVNAEGKQRNPYLPTIIYTVTKITSDPKTSDPLVTKTYTYNGGTNYDDPKDAYAHKFAGFASITETSADGSYTITSYHTGSGTDAAHGEYEDNVAKIGKPYRVESYNSAGKLFATTINKWDSFDLGNSAAFVPLIQSVNQEYDGGALHRDSAQQFVYNNNGFLIQKNSYGEVVANTDGTFNDIGTDKTTTLDTYATNASSTVFRLMNENVLDQASSTIAKSSYLYDRLAAGVITFGNVTQSKTLVSAASSTQDQNIMSSKSYNSYGQVISSTDPKGNTTNFSYDTSSLYLATVTKPLSQTTTYQYDYNCGKIAQTNPNGTVSKTTFDGFCRPIKQEVTDSSGALSTLTTSAYVDETNNNSVKTSTFLTQTKHIDSYSYSDGLSRTLQNKQQAENGNYITTDVSYDSNSRVAKSSLPYFTSSSSKTLSTTNSALFSTNTYDALGRELSVANVVGTVSNDYSTPWSITTTDANGKKKTVSKDVFGHILSVTENNLGSQYITNYTWDSLGKLITIKDALGNIRNFSYDLLGRQLAAEDLHASSTSYAKGSYTYIYDENGNVVQKTDLNGNITVFKYDALNRLLSQKTNSANPLSISYTYDSCAFSLGTSNACSVTKTTGQNDTYGESNIYNKDTSLASQTKTINNKGFTSSYTYDLAHNILSAKNPDNSQLLYTYGNSGQLDSIVSKISSTAASQTLVSNVRYGPTGAAVTFKYGNGNVTTKTYDENKLYRLSNVRTTSPAASNQPHVVARSLFYNNSFFDSNNSGINKADDNAVAQDVVALLPGVPSKMSNVSIYAKGINGLDIDIANLANTWTLSSNDFQFLVGTSTDISLWQPAPTPSSIVVRAGAGKNGSDRVSVTWPDGIIQNSWLQVKVLANNNTGLSSPDISYFGSLVGDVNGSGVVDAADISNIKSATGKLVPITTKADLDHSHNVDAADLAFVTAQVGQILPAFGVLPSIQAKASVLPNSTVYMGKDSAGNQLYKYSAAALSGAVNDNVPLAFTLFQNQYVATTSKFVLALDTKLSPQAVNFNGNSKSIFAFGPAVPFATNKAIRINSSTVIYTDAFSAGIDMEITGTNSRIAKNVLIRSKRAVSSVLANAVPYFEVPFKLTAPMGTDIHIDGKSLLKEGSVTSSSTALISTPAGDTLNIGQTFITDSSNDFLAPTASANLAVRYELKSDGIYITKLIPTSYLASATYPVRADLNLTPAAPGGDGRLRTCLGSWCPASTVGDFVDYTNIQSDVFSDTYFIYRSFFAFDTRSITNRSTVVSATLSLTQHSDPRNTRVSTGSDINNTLAVYQGNQASTTVLSVNDVGRCGDKVQNPTKGSNTIVIDDLLSNAGKPVTFALNATGTTWIAQSDFTKLCIREGHDTSNVPPSGSTGFGFYTSRNSVASFQPRLDIVYYVSAPPAGPTQITIETKQSPAQNLNSMPTYFSAQYNGDAYNGSATSYQYQLSDNPSFTNVIYDSQKKPLSVPLAINTMSPALPYFGTTTLPSTNIVYVRVKFWDSKDNAGLWSSGTDYFSFNTTVRDLQNISYVYDAAGNLTSVTSLMPNGLQKVDTYSYDDLYRLTGATSAVPSLSTTISTESWSYDAVGNMLSDITNNPRSTATTLYEYSTNSLIPCLGISCAQAQSPNPDAPINITTTVATALGTTTLFATSTASNFYDNNGSLVATSRSDGTSRGYSWSNQGDLTSIASFSSEAQAKNNNPTSLSSYSYDHSHSRTLSTLLPYGQSSGSYIVTQVSTFYPSSAFNQTFQGNLTSQSSGSTPQSSTATLHAFLGSSPVASITTTTHPYPSTSYTSYPNSNIISSSTTSVSYIHPDHLGGSSLMSDASGATREYTDYAAYGSINKDSVFDTAPPEQRKYTGHYYDADTALTYMGARYYDAATSRFISQDPNFWSQLNFSDPQSFNSYAYARDNPVMYRDPDGRSGVTFAEGLAEGFAVGAIAAAIIISLPISTPVMIGIGAVGLAAGAYQANSLGTAYGNGDITKDQFDQQAGSMLGNILGGSAAGEVSNMLNNYGPFLTEQEALGGHTIQRHVDIPDSDLIQRAPTLRNGNGQATSYNNIQEAELHTKNTIKVNKKAIDEYIKLSNPLSKSFDSYTSRSTGYGYNSSGNKINPTGSRVVVKPNGKGGYNVTTSFPVVKK